MGPPEIHNKPMSRLFAGTSGFAYAQWKPRFYPAKLPANKFLEHYAQRLNSVEINYTFRRLPSPGTLKNWVEATPAGFVFAVKANQRITHILRLKNAEQATEIFLKAIDPLRTSRRLRWRSSSFFRGGSYTRPTPRSRVRRPYCPYAHWWPRA